MGGLDWRQLGYGLTPNNQLHRSASSRLRRLLSPGELARWTGSRCV
jgi:hypothetical protein